MTRGIEARPSTGLPPIERRKVSGGRTPRQRLHVIDLLVTREGQGQGIDNTAPIDPDKLAEELNQIAEFGKRAWNDRKRRHHNYGH